MATGLLNRRSTAPSPPVIDELAPEQVAWIVGARAVAICAVVFTHVADSIVWDTDWLDVRPAWWWIGNIFSAFATGGVGVFTMISGALLLAPKRQRSTWRFYRRRFLRVVPPYLFWSAVYFAWRIGVEKEGIGWSSFPAALADGGAYYHLWFMLMIGELYLLTPLLRLAVARVSFVIIALALVAWFIGESIVPFVQHAIGHETWTDQVPPAVAYLGYVGYFVLGHLLGRVRLGTRGLLLAFGAWLLGLAWTAGATWRATVAAGGTLSEEWGDHNFYPQVMLTAVSALLLLRNLPWDRLFARRALAWSLSVVSAASFTIYLVHPLLLELHQYSFAPVPFHAAWVHPLVGIPVTALAAIAGCVLFALLVRLLAFGPLRILADMIAPWNAASFLRPTSLQTRP